MVWAKQKAQFSSIFYITPSHTQLITCRGLFASGPIDLKRSPSTSEIDAPAEPGDVTVAGLVTVTEKRLVA